MTTILGIETSCDETAVAIVRNGEEMLTNIVSSQVDIHRRFGGVVPEIASRHHVERITLLIEEALERTKLTLSDIDAVAVTQGPGLVGALLVGVTTAKTLAYTVGVPLIPVHHIAGHIYANHLVEKLQFPLLALVVSGGHTELIFMEDHYRFTTLGQTRDDAVGEAYDKVARLLELPYPGGPYVDRLAKQGDASMHFPRAWLEPESLDFSFSGLKTAVMQAVKDRELTDSFKRDVAASFQQAVIDVLETKTIQALKRTGARRLIIAGGVAANSGLRERFSRSAEHHRFSLSIPPLELCTDNAAMIAAAAYFAKERGIAANLYLNANPGLPLS